MQPARTQAHHGRDQTVARGFLAILACFFLSGFAALLYETAWMRQFSLVFGTSELAVVTVLASYMGGLALGSAASAGLVSRVRRPVLVYGLLELGIAVGALMVSPALTGARALQAMVLGAQPAPPDAGGLGHSVFYLLCALVILALPTAFMGATLPLLTHHAVRHRDQIGRRVGLLYALNTAGAVLGTLAAAFILLPSLGLWGTLIVGAAINTLVFIIAASIGRSAVVQSATPHGSGDSDGAIPAKEERPKRASQPFAAPLANTHAATVVPRAEWVLPIMLVSGAVAFTYEVLWTRLLGHVLGASLFAFATMLASFLTGITLGSAIASRLTRSRRGSILGLAGAQLGTAVLSIVIYYGIDAVPTLARSIGAGEYGSLGSNIGVAALVLLPATLFIGATFPFAVHALARDAGEAPRATARVYAFNTVGAIAGATLAGFVLIPALSFEGAVRLAVSGNLLLAYSACLLRPKASRGSLLGAAAAAVMIALLFQPAWPEKILQSSPLSRVGPGRRVVYYGVGRSATVLMQEHLGLFHLRTNGMPEAAIALRGAPPGAETERWLSALPALARPEARSMLIVGFGGGVAVSGAPPSIETIDVIEIEPKVIDANRAIAARRLHDPLADPRLNIVLNDARSALALTTKRYDVIISQPSHPWTAGASHLYTREFLALARDHLRPGGVFVQWMNNRFVDESLFETIAATILDVFSHVRLYSPRPEFLLFLASDEGLDVERRMARRGDPLGSAADHFGWMGIRSVEDVAAAFALDRRALAELCRGAPTNTDDRNRLSTYGPWAARNPLGSEGFERMLGRHDAVANTHSSLYEGPNIGLNRAYVVRRLALGSRMLRARSAAEAIPDPPDRLFAEGLVARVEGREAEAQKLMRQALALSPNNQDLRFALIQPKLPDLVKGGAESEVVGEVAKLAGLEATVVQAWNLAAQHDAPRVKELEEALSRVRPTDMCYTEAAKLRAFWRTYGPAADASRAREAIAILDRVLAIESSLGLYEMRIDAAKQADLPHVILETAGAAALFIERQAVARRPDLAGQSEAFCSRIIQLVSSLPDDQRVPSPRAREVIAQLESIRQVRRFSMDQPE